MFARYVQKDLQKLAAAGLTSKAQELLAVVQVNPFSNPPPYEKRAGHWAGAYSRRINIQYRLLYEVLPDQNTVQVLRMGSHGE